MSAALPPEIQRRLDEIVKQNRKMNNSPTIKRILRENKRATSAKKGK